jgi:protein Mpv17
MLRGALRQYKRLLQDRPVLTKAATGASLGLVGDAAAQKLEGRETLDYRRLAAFTVFGAGWTGLYNHWWYGTLAKWYPGTGVPSILSKLAWNHAVSNPFAYLPTFYLSMGVMLGLSCDEVVAKAKAEYWPTMVRFWTVWLPTNALMFRFVPVQHQVMLTASVSLVWNTALSVMYAGGKAPEAETPPTSGSLDVHMM